MTNKIGRQNEESKLRRTITGRDLSIFLPFFGLAIAGAAVILFISESVEMGALRDNERYSVEIQAANIDSEIQQVSSDLMLLANQKDMRDLWDDYGVPHSGVLADLSQEHLRVARYRRLYDQIRVFDEGGKEIVRVNFNDGRPAVVPQQKLQNKKDRYYFRDTLDLAPGEVFVSPLDLNIEHGKIEQPLKPMLRFGTPVSDRRGNKRGIVLLNFFGAKLLQRFASQLTAPQGSQAMLLNTDGYWLYSPHLDKNWGFMYEDRKDRVFANDYPDAWQEIKSNESVQIETGRGLFTSKTVYPLLEGQKSSTGSGEAFSPSKAQMGAKEYHWKIVLFAPSEVLYASRNKRRIYAALALTLLALTLAFGSWWLAKSVVLRRQTEEKRKKLIDELQEALGNVKTLQGIIPICMHCKKIRDDDGYWHQVEVYVRNHSQAEFSHSLCTECLKELYPKEAAAIIDRQDYKKGQGQGG